MVPPPGLDPGIGGLRHTRAGGSVRLEGAATIPLGL
jgi:hypothetical protein